MKKFLYFIFLCNSIMYASGRTGADLPPLPIDWISGILPSFSHGESSDDRGRYLANTFYDDLEHKKVFLLGIQKPDGSCVVCDCIVLIDFPLDYQLKKIRVFFDNEIKAHQFVYGKKAFECMVNSIEYLQRHDIEYFGSDEE